MLLRFPDDSGRSDIQPMRAALRGISGPLLRNLRRFEVLRAALLALPDELSNLVAPYDVRLAPPKESDQAQAREDGGESGLLTEVNTLYLYVASSTVEAVLEQRKKVLLARINAQLPQQLVEELRYERAGADRIEQQMNILLASPD